MFQPFTNDFPRADIYELLSPDILHQVIKGSFKDHLVTWVEEYLIQVHGPQIAKEILTDIDRRYVFQVFSCTCGLYDIISIAAAPSFPGLRRFPQGRGFKQWTGDDSKALMKVRYLQNYTDPCSHPSLRFFFLRLPAMFHLKW